ncbi:hypothetical protein Tco_1568520 [Tanacetum coccineum]
MIALIIFDSSLTFESQWLFVVVAICCGMSGYRAFTASANVPTIYIQQFLNTLTHEAKSELSRRNSLRLQDAREQLISAMESYYVIDQPVPNREDF